MSANTCSGCSKPIDEEESALGKSWHPTCFVCQGCKVQISGSFQVRDDLPICATCKPAPASNSSFTAGVTKCTQCSEVINDSALITSTGTFHSACLKCGTCSGPLNQGAVRVVGGKMTCSKCAPDVPTAITGECAGCDQALSGGYVTALNKKWHSQCFACGVCKKPISGARTIRTASFHPPFVLFHVRFSYQHDEKFLKNKLSGFNHSLLSQHTNRQSSDTTWVTTPHMTGFLIVGDMNRRN
ncbi:Paxillin [Planoprotostelium fungivorum]|uniref:Paxillin n=1 Tax=Planoprotostelium fungivorum TaxID=1890364 RepID=A0A2P6N0L3_9EUKA|nr:Paxillin [Planoprotostelium fungivorum]